jgi:hypothetical protein
VDMARPGGGARELISAMVTTAARRTRQPNKAESRPHGIVNEPELPGV